jgi:acetoacetyl-CoA synthetase
VNTPIWRPDPAAIATNPLTRFARAAAQRTGLTFKDYDALHAWSVRDRAAFWRLIWDECEVIGDPGDPALEDGDRFPGARWFPNASLNFAENLLRRRDDGVAIVSLMENGARRELSFADLYRESAALAAALRAFGVEPGDRVAGFLPNVPEAVIAMLATTMLGGVWSSCSPDFGEEGALDRFGQIRPRILIACDGYHYGGRTFDVRERITAIARGVPSIERVVWVTTAGLDVDGTRFDELTAAVPSDPPIVRLPFATPVYVLYSSGTTGLPKCIVHGIGGTLLQHLKAQRLHTGLDEHDRLFFFTTCGWMMWNWLVSALACGTTIVLYDGSPTYPGPQALWDLAERERVTVFGVSPRYLASIAKADYVPRAHHALTAMRMLISTGSPLTDEGFRHVYEHVKADLHLVSMSGGTDLISCFVLGNPNLPVWPGEIQCKGLGMAVDVFDEAGQPLSGAKGELVCTAPFPSCPIGFWDDPGDVRFRSAYFERFPGTWAHGDFAEITSHGGFVIHGRSDAVLNPGGVRIGTAEIYRQLETIDEVAEAVCIGQAWDGDTRVVLFVMLKPGATFGDALCSRIRARIRAHASPRHMPAVIVAVPDIPRTRSGKIAELAVRDVVHGRPVKNTAALANPEALAHFANLEALAR